MKLKRSKGKSGGFAIPSLLRDGIARQRQGDAEGAESFYRKILTVAPDHPEANNNLGILLHGRGETARALLCYERALKGNPGHREARKNLAIACKDTGNPARAIELLTDFLAAAPDDIDALNSLALAHRALGRHQEAEASLLRAHGLAPYDPNTLINLANTWHDLGRNDEAQAKYRLALSLAGDHPVFRFNYANFLKETNHSGEALPILEDLILRHPDFPPPHEVLASILLDLGEIRRALHIQNSWATMTATPASASAFIACTNYDPDRGQQELLACARAWDKIYRAGRPQGKVDRPPVTWRGDGRIRLGYLSPDFRDHPVSYFLRPVLENHDRSGFTVCCYAATATVDPYTESLRALADDWRDITTMTDEQAAALIRRDQVDILVDLAGHSAGNRLGIFAAEPAAVQLSWLGYPNTTGLMAMDFRLSDPWADPAVEGDSQTSERLVRLPNSFFCFTPPADAPAVPPLPVDRNDHVTFGSVNNLRKLNRTVLATWADLLTVVPASRLRIICHQFHDPLFVDSVADFFAGRGIDRCRLHLQASLPREEYLRELGNMDIGLDSFPLCGHTVTLQQLWMGVPVVTLRGERFGGRMGVSILQQCGLEELIAASVEEYVAVAAALADDLPRLRSLRQGLRRLCAAAPFADPSRFTRDLEEVLRKLLKDRMKDGSPRFARDDAATSPSSRGTR
ncbi:MAG: tetratricopeptide repeat protein [Thermodesulfobacteriota bacterium]